MTTLVLADEARQNQGHENDSSFQAIFSYLFRNSHGRLSPKVRALQILSAIQSYVFLAFVICLLSRAKSFGSLPGCNRYAVAVILYHFPFFPAGHAVFSVTAAILGLAYTVVMVFVFGNDALVKRERVAPRSPSSATTPGPNIFKQMRLTLSQGKRPQACGQSTIRRH